MPIRDYFKGDGKKVMKSMKKQYGKKKGKEVFYATANKDNDGPGGPSKEARERMMNRKK